MSTAEGWIHCLKVFCIGYRWIGGRYRCRLAIGGQLVGIGGEALRLGNLSHGARRSYRVSIPVGPSLCFEH